VLGLVKKDDVVTFNGQGIDAVTDDARTYLANYGLFVHMTRCLAGEEKSTIEEKTAILAEDFKWFVDDMPAITRKNAVKIDAFVVSCDTIMKSASKKADKLSAIKALELAFNRAYEPVNVPAVEKK
jgi:hypothetical protein